MRALAGRILMQEQWLDGHVLLDHGRVVAVEPGPPPVPAEAHGTIVPAFVNAHTHLGDAVARDGPIPDTLAEAVRPPDGYKHRVLRSTPPERIVQAMRGALAEVDASGAWLALDFREGGLAGLQHLRDAAREQAVRVRALARPAGMDFTGGEASALARTADGIAISSLPDLGLDRARRLRQTVGAEGKPFALHAAEEGPEDLAPVLGLRPNLLVHLTHATDAQFDAVAAQRIPVAVCPRSNARWLKRIPPIAAMLARGMRVGLGTDNAMLGPCDVRGEAHALRELAPEVSALDALRMLTWHGWACAGLQPLHKGSRAELLVFQAQQAKPELDALGPHARLLHRERGR
ncbi:MAG: amidohydrolase family protein [Halobacteriales archaeon]|nr:amidohydrolase family protein [Halobacteriales archaeon]